MERLAGILLVILALIAVAPCCPNAEPWGWSSEDGQERKPLSSKNTENRGERSTSTDTGDRPKVACATTREACQNLNTKIVQEISAQIKEEFTASYVYLTMSNYFARDDVNLRGFSKFFRGASDEEREHGIKLMDYITKRGASVTYFNIPPPNTTAWSNGEAAVNDALALERKVNDKLLDLHWTAQQVNDPHLQDYLEGEFLTEQVDSIKQLADWSAVLKRVQSNPLGEHIFDQELYDGKR